MASISELRNKRQNTQDLAEKIQQKEGGGNQYQDERFWFPERDSDTGNASALIRFLPEPPGEDMPYVKLYSHGFKSDKTGKWFIENCPTTIGRNCPCCEANSEMWNSGDDGKQVARNRKRRENYYSNILVREDSKNPENEGKVFLFRYGKQIFNIIQGKLAPEFEDEQAVNIFDPWEGADFRFRIRKVDGQTNYSKSEFVTPEEIGSDGEIESTWNEEHSLEAFVKEDNFKSYEELEQKFKQVIGETNSGASKQNEKPAPKKEEKTEEEPKEEVKVDSSDEDNDDDIMSEIESLIDD